MDFLFELKGIEITNLPDASLAHHPREPEEEHGSPDVEEAPEQDPLHPAEPDHLALPVLLRLAADLLHLRPGPRHQLPQTRPGLLPPEALRTGKLLISQAGKVHLRLVARVVPAILYIVGSHDLVSGCQQVFRPTDCDYSRNHKNNNYQAPGQSSTSQVKVWHTTGQLKNLGGGLNFINFE